MIPPPLKPALSNPFYPFSHAVISQNLANDPTLLRTYTKHTEPDPEAAESLYNYALSDSTIRDMVVSRYTEAKVKSDIQERIINGIDFTAMQNEVSTLLDQATNYITSGKGLIPALSTYIEVYSYLSPRFIAPYLVRQAALESMLHLGEGIMGSEGKGKMRQGLVNGDIVVGKLGLAIKKNLGDIGANNRDVWKREMGYLKKAG